MGVMHITPHEVFTHTWPIETVFIKLRRHTELSMIMSPIEERVDEILSSKIEHVLKNVLDSKLRIKINEQAKEIIETKDFSDLIRARSGSLTEDGWFVDYLTKSAQGVLDEKLLSHIEERVELNLNGDEIKALVMEKISPIVEEVIAHENIQQLNRSSNLSINTQTDSESGSCQHYRVIGPRCFPTIA